MKRTKFLALILASVSVTLCITTACNKQNDTFNPDWLTPGSSSQTSSSSGTGTKGDKGDKGDDGKSAYQIWLDNGHTGTEQDFLAWLKGETGEQGQDGIGIESVEYDDNGDLIIHYTDGTQQVVELPEKEETFAYDEYGLPVLNFYGDVAGMSKDKKVTLTYDYEGRSGTCTLKWQGSSSLAYPKKNYTVNFDNAFEAMDGWGEQNKYCLKANYIDYSHARNLCGAQLWSEMVGLRTTLDESVYNRAETITGNTVMKDEEILEKLALAPNNGAVDGFPVCVVINNTYMGLYTFNVPKEGWLFGMYDSTDEQGEFNGVKGAFVCAEGLAGGASNFSHSNNLFGEDDPNSQGFELEYMSDEFTEEEIEASLKRLIDTCIAVNAGTADISALDPYIDWTSVIDYILYSLMSAHFDGISKNYILATYDGTKWFISAYDMDSTFGLYYDGTKYLGATGTTSLNGLKFNILFKVILEDANKTAVLKRRYNELAKWSIYHPMHEDRVAEVFSNFINQIPKPIYDQECILWKSIPSANTNNLAQILTWYHKRFTYVEQQIAGL